MSLPRFVALVALACAFTLAACGADEEGTTPAAGSDATASDTETAGDVGTEDAATGADSGTDSGSTSGPCGYPNPEGFMLGQVVPDLVWENAYRADGTQFRLDFEEVHCADEWSWVTSIHLIVTTGWCPNCPNYINYVDSLGAQIEAAGGLVVFVTTEDNGGNPGTNEFAQNHVSQSAPNGTGIRVGDGDAMPAMQINASPVISFVPTSIIVRKSDMTVITHQGLGEYTLPFVEIATNPELDWSSPGAPTVRPETPTNCGEDDEEVYEPNNRVSDAKTIGVGQFEGGVCDSNPDFYYVDIPGRWSVYLGFDNEVGDLDAYIWDIDEQQPLAGEGGDDVGSYTTDDDEYFEFEGPAYLYVVGYKNATAPYTLLLTAL